MKLAKPGSYTVITTSRDDVPRVYQVTQVDERGQRHDLGAFSSYGAATRYVRQIRGQ